MTARIVRWGSLACLLALAWSCAPADRGTPAAAGSPADTGRVVTTLPDLTRLAPALQERLRNQYTRLQDEIAGASVAPRRGEAYGAMARLLLAAEFVEAADAFFAQAEASMPDDFRWPYYRGHVARLTYQPAAATRHFERALQLQADHEPSLIWLADAYLAQGQPANAEPFLAKATTVQPTSAAAWFGRGRASMARGNHREGIEYLQRARSLDPGAAAIAYQLGLAYRGAGDLKRAEPLLRQPADAAAVVPRDPLMDTLPDLLKGSGEFYVVRGLEAMEARKWDAASADLRTAAELLPRDAAVRVNLGTALFMSGDPRGARLAVEAAAELDPRLPRAQYLLGLILESERRDMEAIARFSAAVALDSRYVEALGSLADALRRTGRVEESLARYTQMIALDPGASVARFGYAMGLVRLARYREAAASLEEASRLHPDQPGLAHALARLLAASPDDAVRDGPRSVALTERLLEQQQTAPVQETMAMAFAEVGRFADAVVWQRRAIATARTSAQQAAVAWMVENLNAYERQQPCRMPWRADDPVHRPGPQPG